jgi:hypothetical protein
LVTYVYLLFIVLNKSSEISSSLLFESFQKVECLYHFMKLLDTIFLNIFATSTLKQQSLHLLNAAWVSREATHTNIMVFGLTRPVLESKIYSILWGRILTIERPIRVISAEAKYWKIYMVYTCIINMSISQYGTVISLGLPTRMIIMLKKSFFKNIIHLKSSWLPQMYLIQLSKLITTRLEPQKNPTKRVCLVHI